MNDQSSGKQPPSVKIFAKTESAPAYAIRDFLHRGDVPFEWTELKNDEQAREVGVENLSDQRLPVCIFPDATRMEAPTIRRITEKLGWFRDPSRSEYDLAIYVYLEAVYKVVVYSSLLKSAMNMNSGTGTSIWRMFHMSSVCRSISHSCRQGCQEA
jgi:thioredoxin reductase (NADPH)